MHLVVQAPQSSSIDVAHVARLAKAFSYQILSNTAVRFQVNEPAPPLAIYCDQAKFDFAYLSEGLALHQVGLVAMDMDSTLITIECIDEIADMLGIKPQVAAITARAMRGEIEFSESLRRRVALLAGLDVAALERVYRDRLRLSSGAEVMLNGFKAVGAKTALVSGGFTFFTDRLRDRLAFDYTISNVLEIERDVLTGELVEPIIDANAKARQLRDVRDALALRNKLTVCIGDGANDLPMFAEADVSVAYRAKEIVREKATYAINYCGLDAILNLFT